MQGSIERLPGQGAVRLAVRSVIAALFLLTAPISASAAPQAVLWDRWTVHDDTSDLTIDHSAWAAFLAKYVRTDSRGVNLVAYRRVGDPDRQALQAYILRLTMAPISTYARNVQLAYWINLYNALTVRLILDNYPVASIRDIDISPGWFTDGPWGRKLVEVEGAELSLDDIEHLILRPVWKDARVHYAVNCASVGCPNLRKRAFTGAEVDAMLTAAAHDYVSSPRAAAFRDGELHVSSLYKWYLSDFGGSGNGVLIHLRKYAEPALRTRLGLVEGIAGHDYDWSLNDDPMPPQAAGDSARPAPASDRVR